MKLKYHMHRFFWMAVGLMVCGLSACLASNSRSTGDLGRYAADPVDGSSATARAGEAGEQIKPHPGSVAAPSPDPTETLKDAVKGTQEILCRSEDPVLFQVRFKGQVFEAPESGDLVPCLDCAGKIMRVVFEDGADRRFADGKIKEDGTFELTFKAPDPHAVSLYVMPAMDPYLWTLSPEEKGSCPNYACTQNFVMQLKTLLEFEEGSLETAPECPLAFEATQKKNPRFKTVHPPLKIIP